VTTFLPAPSPDALRLPMRFAELRRTAFGAVVRRRRLDRGLSRDAVATLVGVSPAQLAGIEDREAMPPLDVVFALGDVLSTDAAELLHDTRFETECRVAADFAFRNSRST
jgi:transcriptional regulator with XRE-family HTH domain